MVVFQRRFLRLLTKCVIPFVCICLITSIIFPKYLLARSTSKADSQLAATSSTFPTKSLITATTPPSQEKARAGHWRFEHARDERNYGLTDGQCEVAFPGYFDEIDRSVKHRNKRGSISEEDLDISWRRGEMLRAMIYDNQLYIIDAAWSDHGFDIPRAIAILSSISRAVVAYPEPLPNIEFSFCVGDVPTADPFDKHAIWTLTRRAKEESKWVMPDFGYWSWALDVVGEYAQVRNEIAEIERGTPFKDKKRMAVWRGAVDTNDLREDLIKATKGKAWSDVEEITWVNLTTMAPGMEELSISMSDHCRYQYVLHTEGHSYSGRGKYLLNCNSVFVTHDLEWIEPHTHLLITKGPHQNAVLVERDWSDLEDKIQYFLTHEDEARRIAANSVKMFRERYLTPAAQACYWRRLFREWASVQGFEPKLWESVGDDGPVLQDQATMPKRGFIDLKRHGAEAAAGSKADASGMTKRLRGVPFETFILQGFQSQIGGQRPK